MDNKEARMALAERARACENWRWMPGMLVEGNRVLSVAYISSPYDYAYASYMGGPVFLLSLDRVLPDLSDAATLGCLLALVREAWGGKIVVSLGNGWWSVETDGRRWDQDNTASILEALVAALEAAP